MKKYIFILGVVCLVACNNKQSLLEKNEVFNDTASIQFVPSSAGVVGKADSGRKFVRTGDIKCSVKSVVNTTYNIENICTAQGGFVSYTNLQSKITNTTEIPISKDSTLMSTYYTVSNDITLRVPNATLDTTLKAIAENIDFLDFRVIKADDVSLQIYANKLTQKRSLNNKAINNIGLQNTSKKLNETMVVEDAINNNQTIADNAQLSNMQFDDKIKYSTVTLNIYQSPTIKRLVVANEKSIVIYEPGLGSKLIDSLQFGWGIFVVLIVNITKLWGLFLLAFIGYYFYKWYNKKAKNILK